MSILNFIINEIFGQGAIFLALVAMVGLILQKKELSEVIRGTIMTAIGFFVLNTGTGLITGGSVRPVLELAGYKDVRTKVLGTNNPRNCVYATFNGLKSMQTIEQVAKKRGIKVEDVK